MLLCNTYWSYAHSIINRRRLVLFFHGILLCLWYVNSLSRVFEYNIVHRLFAFYFKYYVKFSILKSINGWIYIPNRDISNLGLRPRSTYYYLVNKSWHLPHQKPIIVYKHIIVRVFYLGMWNILPLICKTFFV
jgi:hypothetical protein